MKGHLLVTSAICLVTLSVCAHSRQSPIPSTVESIQPAHVGIPKGALRILVHSSEPHGGVAFAEVVAIGAAGRATVGETNEWGTVDVQKSDLVEVDAAYLVICAEWYFCGAIPIEDDTLETYDEVHIELAKFAIH